MFDDWTAVEASRPDVMNQISPQQPWNDSDTQAHSQEVGTPAALTQADEHPLQGLVGRSLQVKEGEFVVRAQLHLMSDCFK